MMDARERLLKDHGYIFQSRFTSLQYRYTHTDYGVSRVTDHVLSFRATCSRIFFATRRTTELRNAFKQIE